MLLFNIEEKYLEKYNKMNNEEKEIYDIKLKIEYKKNREKNIKTLMKRKPQELYKRILNYGNYYNYGITFYTNGCVNTDR